LKIATKVRNKIIWSTFVQYFGKVLQIAIGIVAVKLVTNAIGLEEYGAYGKIAEYALFFSVIANLGIFGNTVRKMSERPEDGKLFCNALILRITTALLFFATGALYAYFFIPEKAFTLGVLFFMSSLLFDYITSICDGMLQANYLMGRAVFALVLGRITNLLIVLLLINFAVSTAPLFFLAPLAASVVTMSLSLLFVRLRIKFNWRLDPQLIKMLLLTAIPFGIINILNNLYFRFLPSFFAIKALTDAQFGSYTISLHIATTVSLFSTYLMFSTLPAFKQSLRDRHLQTAKNIYKKVRLSLIALSLLTIVFGTLLTPFAISLVSDKEYFIPEFWFILPLMLVLASVSYFYDLVLITLFALEKDIWFLKREFLALALGGIVLSLSLLPVDPVQKILLVLIGAIAGESLIVLLGLLKIRKLL
jgi:O-antigen/teichoic acid export membrane protein